jgi:hypothetical protein
VVCLQESLVAARAARVLEGMLMRGFTTVRDAGAHDSSRNALCCNSLVQRISPAQLCDRVLHAGIYIGRWGIYIGR